MSTSTENWVSICPYDRILAGRGVTALVGDVQVAIFRTRAGELFAVGNFDPFSRAYVIARGLIGSHGGIATVASPMYKHAFNLQNGQCLSDESVALPVYAIRLSENGIVEVSTSARPASIAVD